LHASGGASVSKPYETIRQRKDGSIVEISLTISPVRNPEGKNHRRFNDRPQHQRAQAG